MTNPQEEKLANRPKKPRNQTTKPATNDADSETDTDEEEVDKIRAGLNVSVTPEYMQIAKLIKYAKRGNQTATVLALVALKDFDLNKQSIQASLIHLDGISLLVNLLSSNDSRAMIAALKILSVVACNKLVAEVIIRLNGVHILVQHLDAASDEVSTMSADVISDVACSRRARKQVRKTGGLDILLKICQQPGLEQDPVPSRQNSTLSTRRSTARSRSDKSRQALPEIPLEKMRAAANALWNCCRNQRNRRIIASSEIPPYLIRLLETIKDERLQMPAIGIIHCCSVEADFREQMLSSGLLSHVVKAMRSSNREFQILALKAFSVCGDEMISRDQIRQLDGLEVMDSLLHKGLNNDVDLLIAATHAVWKSITDNRDSVNWFKSRSIVQDLSSLLQHSNNEVIVNSLGILSEFTSHDTHNCKLLLDNQVIQLVIKHLETTDCQIIMAASKAVKSASKDEATRRTIIGDDGFRFLWSHLRSRNEEVVSTALDAIFDIVQNPEETATTVRSFLGGLEVLITLMKSKNPKICKSACKVVSRVALDGENLEVLDDYDLSCIIIFLCNTKSEELQKALCSCIVSYAIDDEYRQKLRDTIPYLGQWLTSPDFSVKRYCTHALFKLSSNQENSLLIYHKGAVKHLMSLITCDDENLQESAAECVRNIRLTTVNAVEGHSH